jgi:hypothetical protein
VRAKLRHLLVKGVVEVTEPDREESAGEALLPELGCAITPPARYARVSTNEKLAQWSRLSFAGTDGVQLLTLARTGDGPASSRRGRLGLQEHALQVARTSLPPDATDVCVETRALPRREERAQAAAYLAYEELNGHVPRHTAFHLLVDDEGCTVIIALAVERCVPEEELLADIESVARSWRPLNAGPAAPTAKERPWWQFW